MDEFVWPWVEGDVFDILSWWKSNGPKYPLLSRIVRDIVAIPVSTIASESAFSTDGRVIYVFWISLDPDIIEAIIYLQDWLRSGKKDNLLYLLNIFIKFNLCLDFTNYFYFVLGFVASIIHDLDSPTASDNYSISVEDSNKSTSIHILW